MGAAAWQFAGSLAAVAIMVALAWRLGFAGSPELSDESEAGAVADGLHGGFRAVEIGFDHSRHAALLRDASGRIAIVHPHGAHFVARLLDSSARAHCQGETLVVTAAGRATKVELGAAKAADWAAAIDRLV